MSTNNDNTKEFKVASRTEPKKLATAITTNLRQNKSVTLVVIGHGAIGQAMKAIPIVNQEAIAQGKYYAVVPSFQVRNIDVPDGQDKPERTVLVLTLLGQTV